VVTARSTERDGYLPTLDGWRAIAIALVLVGHSASALSRLVAYGQFHMVGLLGVQVFFGLSGFLITSRLIREEEKYGRISLRQFYGRRFFRILPAAATFLTAVGLLHLAGVIPLTFGRWISSLFPFANYTTAEPSWFVGHFWSLAVEEHFYFVWPSIFLALVLARRRIVFAIGAAFAVALWRAIDASRHITWTSPEMFWTRTDIQGDGLLWGVALALIAADSVWGPRARRLVRPPIALPLLAIAVVFLQLWEPADWKLAMAVPTIKGVVIPLMLYTTLIEPQRVSGRILESASFRFIGVLSYSLYLWQQLFFVRDSDRVPGLSGFDEFPINLLSALACAYACHKIVEKPLIAFSHRWLARSTITPAR